MPTLQSPGVGSGLNVNALVSQLVSAERAPRLAQITRAESRATVQITALGALKGALSGFRSTLTPLTGAGALTPHKATSGDTDIFTATAATNAATGNYDIEVVALAKAHRLVSDPYLAGSTAVVGTGTLTLTQGTTTFSVNIDSDHNTLAGIRDAINAASGNPGVQATLINEVGGSRLVLTSSKTGTDGAIRVTQSGGDGGLEPLVFDPPTTTNLTEAQGADQAHIRIGLYDHYSATNSISGAIDGVTLDLKAANPGTMVSLTITNDDGALLERVRGFVSAYNGLYGNFTKLRSYNAETKQGGPLLGDALLQGIEEKIRSGLSNPVTGLTGTYTSLASVGITKQVDGTMKLDEAKFNAALNADRNGVVAIFGSEKGVASRLSADIEAALASTAGLEARSQRLTKSLKAIEADKAALDARMDTIEKRYRAQFTALDTLLARMQQTSSFLSQQLSNLPRPDTGN